MQSLSDVQDILYEVFPHLNIEHYVDQEEIARARKTLLHSALTCRNFMRPALDVLWSCLPSDQPLLQLLCTLGIVQGGATEGSALGRIYTYSSLDNPRSHPRWGDFQDYASRVRSIALDPFTARERSVWNNLVPLLLEDPVLPALRKAILSQGKPMSREDVALMLRLAHNPRRGPLWLISPSVQHLSVSLPERGFDVLDSALQEAVQFACRMAPALKHLHVLTPWPINLQFLRNHEHLRVVELDTMMDTDDLDPISTLPCLESLSVYVHTAPPTHLAFDHVRALVLKGPWPQLEMFLEHTDLPQLRSLSVTASQHDPALLISECAGCFRTLSSKHSTQLNALHVKCHHRPLIPFAHFLLASERAPTGGTLSAVVEPLLSLHELHDVSLIFDDFILPYGSSDIQSFAESWPYLESFRLELATQEHQRAGFESLVYFLRHCPQLRALHLPEMELAKCVLENIAYPEGQPPHPLRELDVAQVAFPKGTDLSHEMALFTQKVFPHAASPMAVAHPIVVTDEESGGWSQLV